MANDADLARILQATRQAVLTGNLSALADLALQTEAALAAGLPRDAARLDALRLAASQNAPLLAAAMKGISAARRRLRDLTGEGRFSTYGSDGHRDVLGANVASPARRL